MSKKRIEHRIVNDIEYKKCSKCGEWKQLKKFSKSKGHWDGFYPQCKCCVKQYKKDNIDKIKHYQKQYCIDNKDKKREYDKQYNKDNIDKRKENVKRYYQTDKGRMTSFNRSHKRRLLEEQQGSGITVEQYKEVNGYFNWKCAYSNEKLNNKKYDNNSRTLDHIIPIKLSGVNEIWNLIPMARSYNISKKDKNPLQWYKEQPYYSIDKLNKIIEWQKYAYEKYCDDKENVKLILITEFIN